MALLKGSISAFNAIAARKVNYMPKHFASMTISHSSNILDLIDTIDLWISQNLNSRYAIFKGVKLSNSNTVVEVIKIGIEDKGELAWFCLACPHLTNSNRR